MEEPMSLAATHDRPASPFATRAFSHFISRPLLIIGAALLIAAAAAVAVETVDQVRRILMPALKPTVIGWITLASPILVALMLTAFTDRLSGRLATLGLAVFAVSLGAALGLALPLLFAISAVPTLLMVGAATLAGGALIGTFDANVSPLPALMFINILVLLLVRLAGLDMPLSIENFIAAIIGMIVVSWVLIYDERYLRRLRMGHETAPRLVMRAALAVSLDIVLMFVSCFGLFGRRR